ncbi:hypothetical protein BS17DRAFT_877551 [Gyrodon lividus]|nr:hypothetical protein BS17DRAFT_877551 [Gyrodon lividus]
MSGTDTAAEVAPSHEMDQPCSPEEDWDPSLARGDDDSDVNMAPPDAPDHPPFLEAQPEQLSQGGFIEMFTGCAESFPGGKTFMDVFREDHMASIDSLLSLDIIKSASLSFHSAKELRTCAEILPRGPQWICCIYDEWLSGDCVWSIQEVLPPGASVLGVVLSSDKTNISVMTSNHMAHPVLISLANIDAHICSKTSLHAYLLLALLPIAKFTHKTTRVRSLLQDCLVHQSLNIVLSPLKTAAAVGVMMSDPVGNLRYCFTPLASWIADMPEQSLLAATGTKVSPITIAMSKNFGDAHCHPPRTAETTLAAIHAASSQHSPTDYKNFLKAMKSLHLNGVVEPFWATWVLSGPSEFLHPEPLHHFARMFWDHDLKWCITVVGASELDFRFSIIQTPRYIIGAAAGSAPRKFLMAIRALIDFRYLAQVPLFTTQLLERVKRALQEFHDNKDAIVCHGARTNWEIPKLELLQSVVPSIIQSGAVMQWTADVTEHAHVQEIKEHVDQAEDDDSAEDDNLEGHEPDTEPRMLIDYSTPTRPIINYFTIFLAILQGSYPSAPRPFHTFATATTAFHLATKPSLRMTVAEASIEYGLPDLSSALSRFLAQ